MAWFRNHAVSGVILEACGSAHHWARWLTGLGIEVTLLPAAYVRAYVKRNKTDAADAAALLEAARCADITPVQVKSIEQQALQGLHRIRSLWMGTRTSRINALRVFCREFGIAIAAGSRTGVESISRVLADPNSAVPEMIRGTLKLLIEEIRLMEARIAQIERELTQVAKDSEACKLLLSIPGVGSINLDRHGRRHQWQSDAFQGRTPFCQLVWPDAQGILVGQQPPAGTHFQEGGSLPAYAADPWGARSVLRSAVVSRTRGQEPGGVRAWALAVQGRTNHNKAACALANKMARICYAVLRDGTPFGQPAVRLSKKISRQAFEMAA